MVTGITCLFVAAKVEEIYPPKIAEFAFVTDSACSENEILDMELIILKVTCFQLILYLSFYASQVYNI